MNALASESLSEKERSELMQQIKQEVAVANAQELLSVRLQSHIFLLIFEFKMNELRMFDLVFSENVREML